jgi:hypothetical protein
MSSENPGRVDVEFVRAVRFSFQGSRTQRVGPVFCPGSHYFTAAPHLFYFETKLGLLFVFSCHISLYVLLPNFHDLWPDL